MALVSIARAMGILPRRFGMRGSWPLLIPRILDCAPWSRISKNRPGRFRARLTQITLHNLRVSAAEEHLPRIAFAAVPADAVLVLLPIGGGPSPGWARARS